METNSNILLKVTKRKLLVCVLLLISTVGAFATLGDGKTRSTNPKRSLLSDRTLISPGKFSLKSGYNFRGSQVINFESGRYININAVVTYQKGNSTYIVPLKKRVLLDKITFNPNPATRR
ncbi:MAG TPA: hypothetical protein VET23_02355 [Chitinophagaceae bacterium]|nr:hypothetical protein [Chitinophagaceae bacterium]